MPLHILPSLSLIEPLAKPGRVVPLVHELIADTLTAVTALATVGQGDGSYLLESVVGGEKWGRYSFVGFEPDLIARALGDELELCLPDGVVERRKVGDQVIPSGSAARIDSVDGVTLRVRAA
jgi:anthranilate synthase component 1